MTNVDLPRIASRAEWLAARKALLAREKELTRQRDALSAERQKLPMVRVQKQYTFQGADEGELPGLSVFFREGDEVLHAYSTYQRGLDLLLDTYNLLDLSPLGRQEQGELPQAWVRHHDRYEA